jgi:N-acyl-D-amino-acid deacylase
MVFDIVIKNATIYDGENTLPYIGDVAIVNEKIARIGNINERANIIIDAKDKILTPGFIDAHSHGDQAVFGDSLAKNQLLQGITTEITGQCGNTVFPNKGYVDPFIYAMLGYKTKKEVEEIVAKQKTFGDYIKYLKQIPIGVNMLSQVGHGAIREYVIGHGAEKPTLKQLEQMKELLIEAMENGAIGMSSGLIYAPGVHSDTEELIELAKIVAKYDGRYSSHIRSESNYVIEATKEAIKIGEESGCQVILSHHKANGKKNWGKSIETLRLVDDAVNRGVDIYLDQYPYNAGATKLIAIIPNEYSKIGVENLIKKLQVQKYRQELQKFIEADNSSSEILLHSANGWSGVILASNGKTIEEIAKKENKSPFDVFFDTIIETEGTAMAVYKCMHDDDVERIMKYPRTTFGTDATHSSFINPFGHPRAFGSFSTILKKYVLEKKILTLQEAVYKSSGLTAKIANIKERGFIKENYFADINVIDLDKLKVNSSFSEPSGSNEGLNYVFVNGKIVVENDKVNNILNGKVLKRND